MEYEKIKKLMDDMGNSKLTSVEIDFPDGTKISMKKEEKIEVVPVSNSTTNENRKIEAKEETKINKPNENEEESLNIIKSPMVGTFYLKPSPTSEPYVEIGSEVKKGDTVCIIEAMKLMNEIESEFDGKIVKIFVKDGEPVEYGKPLFGLK